MTPTAPSTGTTPTAASARLDFEEPSNMELRELCELLRRGLTLKSVENWSSSNTEQHKKLLLLKPQRTYKVLARSTKGLLRSSTTRPLHRFTSSMKPGKTAGGRFRLRRISSAKVIASIQKESNTKIIKDAAARSTMVRKLRQRAGGSNRSAKEEPMVVHNMKS